MIDSFFTCDDIDKCLERLINDKNNYNFAVGTSRIHATASSHFKNHRLFCFDRNQNVANYSMSLLIRNDLGLVNEINAIVRNIVEGGLISKWHTENSVALQPFVGHNVTDSLGMQYASALFYFIYFPAIIVSTAIFFAECFIAQKLKQPRRLKLWGFMSDFFDGHRHIWKFDFK